MNGPPAGHEKGAEALAGACRQALAFLRAARCYWLEIFPLTRRELGYWRRKALAIPDPELRRDALFTQQAKWGHSEGAAAFALLVPRPRRTAFVRMAIAYELMLDYLDTTSERPVADPFANTLRLHRALGAALALDPSQGDYYATHPHGEDGGYLAAHVAVCREIFASLPSCRVVAAPARRFAALYAEAQGLCHATEAGRQGLTAAERTRAEASRHPQLLWGEVLAAGGSSLPVLALLASAVMPRLSKRDVAPIAAAYYPWVSSLHILLHGLVDQAADRANGQFNQLSHYRSQAEAAERLTLIATRARLLVSALPQGEMHATILAGMGGYYLASPQVWEPGNAEISRGALDSLGPLTKPALLVHRLRREGPFRLGRSVA